MTRHARCAGLRLTPLLWLVALSCAQPTNAGPRRFEADDKQVHALAFSPDAKLMATAGADRLAKLWAVEDGAVKPKATLRGHDQAVTSLGFSPDGKLLATGSNDRTARLWDTKSGRPVATLTFRPMGPVKDVAFSPDGRTLAAACWAGAVRLFDVRTHEHLHSMSESSNGIWSVAFSPDGKVVVSGGAVDWKRWDSQSGRLIGKRGVSTTSAIAFAPDGKTVATGSWDQKVRIWNTTDGRLVRTLAGHGGAIMDLAFSSDGKLLLSAGDDSSAFVWEAGSGKVVRQLPAEGPVHAIALSPDGRTLAWGDGRGVLIDAFAAIARNE